VNQYTYAAIYDWTIENGKLDLYTSLITSLYDGGCTIGALSAGLFIEKGKWKMIMCCNVLMAVGYAFTIYAHLWAVFVGRITLGLGVGSYCVYCIKFVSELAPIEYRGPIGAVAEFSIATGRFFPAIGGLFID